MSSLLVLNHTASSLTQMLFMFLVGLSILANMFVSEVREDWDWEICMAFFFFFFHVLQGLY